MVKMGKNNMFILSVVLIPFFLFVSCGSTSTSPPDSKNEDNNQTMDVIYNNVMTYQLQYIRSLQLSSGAIKDKSTSDSKITPYFAHFAVMALLKSPTSQNIEAVKNYIKWYLSKLNGTTNPQTGKREVEGSVYDYFGDAETTKGTYDSVDSYAATFLDIIMAFAQISSENVTWLAQYKAKLSLVASAMVATIDTENNTMPGVFSPDNNDYLSIAHYNYDVKYLMDNCEVNSGLKAAKWLKEKNIIDGGDFATMLSKNTASMESALYTGSNYKWMEGSTVVTNWSIFYPDATSQLYPGLFQVIEPGGDKANKMYTQFNKSYPSWPTGVIYGNYPWTMIAYAAATINDSKRVNQYLTYINSLNIKGQQMTNWYSAEAGCLVLAIDRIKNPVAKEYVANN